MSLARLLHDQGRGAAGRDSLAAACARFAEGFVTGDLVEAKALLDALGTSSADHGSSSAGAIT
jgi:predicted ATPase